jgi:(E)-4-hydroxy-3-methylbut-2-enyl-diphosphate synthase
LRHFAPEIISCPTCGRCEVDLVKIVKELEKKLTTYDLRLTTKPPKVAVMGCVVNGPGEAKEADVGVAFGKKEGLLFKKGRPIKKISSDRCVNVLLKEILK